ncbi:hypothetical protein CCACVL1_06767 [Corchorus capsularis]|uniref:Uncharacterized protein n=1 Tax=Corchorus capsularis TaxID=210143 RepID=A0A1R3JD16_COCAP|nr:hypothetical protein CCACVL1_06767 [Corchorus capsularis]
MALPFGPILFKAQSQPAGAPYVLIGAPPTVFRHKLHQSPKAMALSFSPILFKAQRPRANRLALHT